MNALTTAALALSAFAVAAVGGLAFDLLSRDVDGSCRVQVLTTEERLRDAVRIANDSTGDKIAALIRALERRP